MPLAVRLRRGRLVTLVAARGVGGFAPLFTPRALEQALPGRLWREQRGQTPSL